MNIRFSALLLALSLAPVPALAQDGRPNILLLVADDLGYADLGVYGGDIRTPNIDALARDGVLFTQFHTAPVCSPTRAMLLTGNNNHVAGIGRQGLDPSWPTFGLPGFEGRFSNRVALLPDLLRDTGYRTYMAGKWHLGAGEAFSPAAAGFDRSFAFEDGYANHFNGIAATEAGSVYREDGQETDWPIGAYSTEFYTDKLIEYLETDRESERPFFIYAAYSSPHWPLQVPEDELDLYAGLYDMGYDALREQRFESLMAAGILPSDSRIPPRNEAIVRWDELAPDAKRREARKMELYAAMVDNLDRQIGRLLDYLRTNGLYDNTLIVFMSDNGAAAEDFYHVGRFSEFLQAHYDNRYGNMGLPESWVSYGPQWAEAGSAPFKRYKGFTTEGGIVAPMIIAGPGVAHRPAASPVYATVSDLAPTFLEMAGAAYPNDKAPMVGESAWSFLSGETDAIHGAEYVSTLFREGRAFLRQGDWKLVSIDLPFDERNFVLYDVAVDPGETNDLSAAYPQRREALIRLWRSERRKMGILLPQDL